MSIVGSVFDRLTSPEGRVVNKTHAQAIKDLKQAVGRDLECLLNTRWRCKAWPPNLNELDRSLINYGIPDFSAANLGASTAREEFRKIVAKAIEDFEPRFAGRATVTIVKNVDPSDRTLRFRIQAVLRVDSEAVVFDTAMEPATAAFRVKRVDR